MKNLIILTIIFSALPVFSQAVNDNPFYVTSKNGLVLRERPTANAKSLLVIPYRTSLKILETGQEYITVNKITGRWKKVEYNSAQGWVFGGYLDRIDPDYRMRCENKKCNYKESIVECPDAETVIGVEPFKSFIDGNIPCIIGKDTFDLRGNIRRVRVSKNGLWMVVESGTDFRGSLRIYNLPRKKLLFSKEYMSIEYKSENAFEYAIVDSDCFERVYRFEEGKLSEIRKTKTSCMPK